jgi:cytochrome c oxidase subunit 2
VQKWWSVLFGVVLAASFGLFAVAPFVNWWLPARVSSYAWDVDYLFYVILALTGFFFVLTEAILVYAMWRFAHAPGRRATYVEGSHRLEVAWTIVPSVILLYIAFAQVKTWEEIKYASRTPPPDLVLQVSARQWEWRLRYAADLKPKAASASDRDPDRTWAEAPQVDDVILPNEVHTWKGANTKAYLKTQDVIHSFFLPHLRLKQDALPGKTIPIWFQAIESNVSFAADFDQASGRWREPPADRDFELACAELCGGGHYRMRGRLFVHPDEADYRAWLDYAKKRQGSREPEKPAAPVALNAGK